MFLATRPGNAPHIIPTSFRASWLRAGWKLGEAPPGIPEVVRPTLLAELQTPKVSVEERTANPSGGPLLAGNERRRRR